MTESQLTEQFIRLLAVHERRLSAYIFTLVPNRSDAEQITQEVKMRLWQQFGDYDPSRDFGVWSRAVAYYFILSYRKQTGRQPRVLSHDVLEALTTEVEAKSAVLDARHEALAFCLSKLTPRSHDLVMRWYSGGETSRQIAASLGRSFDATRKSILRIRNQLAECVRHTLRREALE